MTVTTRAGTKTDPRGGSTEQKCPPLRTVCVIETASGSLFGATAFPDTPEGNSQAEARFISCVEENSGKRHPVKGYSPYFDADSVLEQGYWHQGDYSVYITHT